MLPTIEQAERLLWEAEQCNPGPWGNHSRVVARCAREIASRCPALDPEKAYILGLLHDIGRKFGKRQLGHVSDGCRYMLDLGYDEAARICLTHSFSGTTTDEYIGAFDTTPEELTFIQDALKKVKQDDYDRLIKLCDAIAGSEGVLNMKDRVNDVKSRYGSYPQALWELNLSSQAYFEQQMGENLYTHLA